MTAPTTHMDRRLQLIAHLYEEDIEGLEPLDRLLEDPDLKKEYALLRESRFALDHRTRARPDPASIEAIVAAARPAKADRPPLRLVRMRRVLVPAMAAAATLLFVFLKLPVDQSGALKDAAPQEETASAESLLRTLPPAAPEPAPAALAEAGMEAETVAEVPTWDSGRDLRRLSRRIAALKAAGVEDWDEEAVPLEMFPTEAGSQPLLPVGASRPGN